MIQKEEFEDFNMVSVKWIWTLDDKAYQIVLRHGRRSGIRKIYVNKELVEVPSPPSRPDTPHPFARRPAVVAVPWRADLVV